MTHPWPTATETLLAVGSYTEPYGPFRAEGEGISLVSLRADGSLSLEHVLTLRNPAYLRHAPARDLLYAALETGDGTPNIAVVAIDRGGRRLRVAARASLPGAILCHLDLHPGADWIAGACYGSGHVSARRIGARGIPEPGGGATIARRGSSVNLARQASAHPHAARFSPDGRWLVVPDLGTDEVASYHFDAATGALGAAPRVAPMEPGSGPRMLLFDPRGRHVVLVHELAGTVSSFSWDNGTLCPVSRHPALLAPHDGANTTAGLRWHPSGGAFAVSNRGADRVTLFRFDPGTGGFQPVCDCASGGAKPRDFEFSPCGRFLVVANQDGDSLHVLAVDLARGRLAATGHQLRVRSPSCVRVLP